MEETKLTAALPNLEIQIVHRENPEDGTEIVAVQLKATPSFQALRGTMVPTLLPGLGHSGPGLGPGLGTGLGMAGLWLAPMQASLQMWSGLMQQAWAPWLNAFRPQIPPRQ